MGRINNFINDPFRVAIIFYANYILLILFGQQLVPGVAKGFINPGFNFLLPIIMLEPLVTGIWKWRTGKLLSVNDEVSLIAFRLIFMATPLALLDFYHLSLLIDRLLR